MIIDLIEPGEVHYVRFAGRDAGHLYMRIDGQHWLELVGGTWMHVVDPEREEMAFRVLAGSVG